MTNHQVVERYRTAAMTIFGITRQQAEEAIYAPEDDPGEWAPTSKAILNLETGALAPMGYWEPTGFHESTHLSRTAGFGFIEYVNAAVAAVYE